MREIFNGNLIKRDYEYYCNGKNIGYEEKLQKIDDILKIGEDFLYNEQLYRIVKVENIIGGSRDGYHVYLEKI